ncbi:MAG: hypothetical protein QG646_258 [Euryarchaeota archaeon]|nr:hypothetical protein [Euryarchaeota archaeon]
MHDDTKSIDFKEKYIRKRNFIRFLQKYFFTKNLLILKNT